MTNIELKEQLLNEGYYVQVVGIQNEPDYLIVSVHEPYFQKPEDSPLHEFHKKCLKYPIM